MLHVWFPRLSTRVCNNERDGAGDAATAHEAQVIHDDVALSQLRQFSEKIDNLKFFRAVFDRKLFDGET